MILATSRAATLDRLLATASGLIGLVFVLPLLAWVYDLGPFHLWFWWLAVPALIGLSALAVLSSRDMRLALTRQTLALGFVSGLAGTLAYDLVRVPFSAMGFRLLAPIDSYGVLILNADGSSPWTGLAGWAYHFLNGVGFAIFYVAFFRGQHWVFGVLWAFVLETATIVTPFADFYGLRGKADLIGIAYAAHVPFGLALGLVARRADRWTAHLREMGPHSVAWLLAALAIGLVAWHRPWATPELGRAGRSVAAGPSAVISSGRFSPQWLRVDSRGCATIQNRDRQRHIVGDGGGVSVEAGEAKRVCFSGRAVQRVKLSSTAYSGGFVIIDPQA